MTNEPVPLGLLDTSVVIDLFELATAELPRNSIVSALSLAELSAGVLTAAGLHERSIRQNHLQIIEAHIEVVPFDAICARSYAAVSASMRANGRHPRGGRAIDAMIAATAVAHRVPLYTRNPADFAGLDHLVDVRTV